ncbi:hypothetical protein BBF93_13500 [Hyphomonas sp. CACIAM 19H1]|uniref:hypothetical protein n=1 Tax=Hyphomonas sp. CACIAM 19H1 TaxID=1873716 RepID=UPI000DED5885|nr:hypothetical protein [Hyphomonas sp. CACIAM 19H1]AXE65120.1 hypothetical protein BBF93_13500 [Hyphomonas sp. CACIAM 19H1]
MLRSVIAAAVLASSALPAFADFDPDRLATCMKSNTTPELKTNVKQVMIHALQDQKPEANAALLNFSFSALAIATSQCGMSFADVQNPKFESAVETYAQLLGEEILNDALAMMDMPAF